MCGKESHSFRIPVLVGSAIPGTLCLLEILCGNARGADLRASLQHRWKPAGGLAASARQGNPAGAGCVTAEACPGKGLEV